MLSGGCLADTASGGGEQADTLLWVHTPDVPAAVAQKFLREFKRGLFSKSPLFRALPLWRFFLIAFSLRLRNQRKSGYEI